MVLLAIVLFVARFYMAKSKAKKDVMVEYEQKKAMEVIESAHAMMEKKKKHRYTGKKAYQKVPKMNK